MPNWTAFPHTRSYPFDAASLRKQWAKLHAGDREPLPTNAKVLAAWVMYHKGEFRKAFDAGMKLGDAGITVANKAACMYANYLEPREKSKHELFLQAAERAAAQAAAEPGNANAFFLHAYALGRYSQGISVAKALAQGVGGKIKSSLESAIRLEPRHADAYVTLGTFHAEVIDKVGALIGNMTYGARKDVALEMFAKGLGLTPKAPIALIEYANGLVILEGDAGMDEATALYERAAKIKPLDAVQRLDVEVARAELEE